MSRDKCEKSSNYGKLSFVILLLKPVIDCVILLEQEEQPPISYSVSTKWLASKYAENKPTCTGQVTRQAYLFSLVRPIYVGKQCYQKRTTQKQQA